MSVKHPKPWTVNKYDYDRFEIVDANGESVISRDWVHERQFTDEETANEIVILVNISYFTDG